MKTADDMTTVPSGYPISGVLGAAGDRLQTCPTLSEQARREMLALPGEPFWLCDWKEVVFLHFEVAAATLQREVPFPLDLFEGRAIVSLVAFTLADMRPRVGGWLARLLFKPFGTHRYLNLRAYVRHRGHAGIYFLSEWLDAPWLNLLAGPAVYGLPFRSARLDYQNRPDTFERVNGTVKTDLGNLRYAGKVASAVSPALEGSLAEFLVERYRAFTSRRGREGWFPVWHRPWRIGSVKAGIKEATLFSATGEWMTKSRLIGAHWAADAGGVWMGWRQTPGRKAPDRRRYS